jgi:hypothetical protein
VTRRPAKVRSKRKAPRRPARVARAISKAPKREPLDDFIDGGLSALELTIDASWLPMVRSHLQLTLQHGQRVASFALPDDAEPAPVFEA